MKTGRWVKKAPVSILTKSKVCKFVTQMRMGGHLVGIATVGKASLGAFTSLCAEGSELGHKT